MNKSVPGYVTYRTACTAVAPPRAARGVLGTGEFATDQRLDSV